MKDLLLVIDMQNVYLPGQPWACVNMPQVIHNILTLLKGHYSDGMFSLFLPPESPTGIWRDYNRAYADINANLWMSELIDEFLPFLQEYPSYTKSVYSCYGAPAMREALLAYDRVIITGVVSECCVLSTVCSAIDAGQKVIYLTDAVAGMSEESTDDTQKVLMNFSPMHLTAMTTSDYMESIIK